MAINYGSINHAGRNEISDAIEHELTLARLDGYIMCLEWVRANAHKLFHCDCNKEHEAGLERCAGEREK